MYASTHRSLTVVALLALSHVLRASARRTRSWAKALGARYERRLARRVGLQQLSAMTDRELQDIGLSRSDIERVAAQRFAPRNIFRVD
jgi:uncharacterized protein YjiS (DUF1127 family)